MKLSLSVRVAEMFNNKEKSSMTIEPFLAFRMQGCKFYGPGRFDITAVRLEVE